MQLRYGARWGNTELIAWLHSIQTLILKLGIMLWQLFVDAGLCRFWCVLLMQGCAVSDAFVNAGLCRFSCCYLCDWPKKKTHPCPDCSHKRGLECWITRSQSLGTSCITYIGKYEGAITKEVRVLTRKEC